MKTVSVIVVNYNGKEYTKDCVESVLKSNYDDLEVIVVDNGSTDGSREFLEKTFGTHKNFKLLCLEKNFGPSYARNRGVGISSGEYLAFLDNDTKVDKDWLTKPIELMEKDKTLGACQCKLLLMQEPEKLDYVGEYLSPFGFLVQRQKEPQEKDTGQYDRHDEVLAAKSAGMVIKREAFEKAGGFDPDYFIYVEETDLGWRVWLKGFKIIFVPQSRVYHLWGTSAKILGPTQNYFVKFHGTKNYILTLIKNLSTKNLFIILPKHLFLWFAIAGFLLLKGFWRDSFFVLKGIFWNLLNLSKTLAKRRRIQKSRVFKDEVIFSKVMRKVSLSYFYDKLAKPHKIGNAPSWTYREKG